MMEYQILSSCSKIRKEYENNPEIELFSEKINEIEEHLPKRVIEVFEAYKTPDETIDLVKKFLYEENIKLEEIIEDIKENLKNDKIKKNVRKYNVCKSSKLTVLIQGSAMIVELSKVSRKVIELLINISPVFTIEEISKIYNRKKDSFKDKDEYIKFTGDLEEKYKISQDDICIWKLYYSYENQKSGVLQKEILKETLEENKENIEVLKNWLSYLEKEEKNAACYLLYKVTGDKYFTERPCSTFFGKLSSKLKCSSRGREIKVDFKKYIMGEIPFEDVEKYIENEEVKFDFDIDDHIWNLPEDYSGRSLKLLFAIDQSSRILDSMIGYIEKNERGTVEDFIDILLEADVKHEHIVCFMAEEGEYLEVTEWFEKALIYLIKKEIDVLENLKNAFAEARVFAIKSIYNSDLDKETIKNTFEYLKDTSKMVRETAIEVLSKLSYEKLQEAMDVIKKYAKIKNKTVRMATVEILLNFKEEEEVKEILKEVFEKETEPKIKDLLVEGLEIDIKKLYVDENGYFDILLYVDELVKQDQSNKVKIPIEQLTKIRWKDKEEYIDEHVIKYFVKSYMESDELRINKDALLIGEHMNQKDLKEFVTQILNLWIEDGCKAKEKWMCLLASIHGDYNMLYKLNKLILELASSSKQKMASYVVKALALNGSSEALILVDAIGRKFKYKSVRTCAQEAFQLAAKELGCSVGQLQDKIVPTLGFTDVHYKEYDYGNRVLKVYINDNLQFEIEKEDGKTMKSLPKANKNDDEVMVQKAKDDFKILKKELKDAVKSQIDRMEEALSDFRMWNMDEWNELFMKNPIMHRLGKKLLWGQYEGSTLVKTFIYDDEIYDVNVDTIELDKDKKISIVHPLELSKEEKEAWKEIFEDNEIEQFFPQIKRRVFVCEDETIKFIEDFKNKKIDDTTFVNRISVRGWYKGSVTDGGGYDEFYKENIDLKIGAEVTLDEYLGVYGLGYEDVAAAKVEFYKAGTIERGSYVYDEIDEERRIKPIDVPKRYYSEILYDVYKVIEGE
ncbi:DUF4132 domain-containing protein [Oceanirhabdus sp. W0125-5]|uniref:DUF4132 domain-containing protein n=1 Tax=Oceanirhabdus sp. W0125-5 TaxID=2999116 RepID=UPI0022F347C3|nr:DUF4132 domain-containing protein [Oceanirhabdus sp. W0125-5]WBW96273.1 DUF4132 domain-containing protein [Oceanirhabdus sp. W0125-5]